MLIIGVNLEITRIVHNKCVSACVAEYRVIAHALLCTFFKISLIFAGQKKRGLENEAAVTSAFRF